MAELNLMSLWAAVQIIELEENPTEEEQRAAWQYIWDSGAWRHLQGSYGRTVHQLVEMGVIEG